MPALYVALDLETTGLDAERDAVIEIGACKFQGDKELETFQTFVNPGRPIPAEITILTGIRDEDVAEAPSLQAVLPALQDFVGDLPIVNHNVGFDLSFLRRWGVLTRNHTIDTFKLAVILVPEAPRYSLIQLLEQIGYSSDEHSHRAVGDARAAYHLFLYLLERARALPAPLLEELVRLGIRAAWPLSAFFKQALQEAAQAAFSGPPPARSPAEAPPLFAVPPTAEPLEPAETRQPLNVEALCRLLEDGGDVARRFPGYEQRPQQIEMLRAVAEAFNHGTHLLVEAPTGVGKSLAYLIPAVHWAVQNNERVVISTNTINLQEQLYRKDLPDLAHALPLAFRAAVLKGRSHYLCRARLEALRRLGPSSVEEMDMLARVLVWLQSTADGDGDVLFMPTAQEQAIWRDLSAEHEGCEPDRCRAFNGCFFYRARRAAEAAHLVIVNHALLLADVAVQNRAIPDYRFLIVDEAHHLEDATTRGLSFETDLPSIRRLLEEIGRERPAAPPSGLLGEAVQACRSLRLDPAISARIGELAAQAARTVERASAALETFFERLEAFVADEQDEGSPSIYACRLRVTPAQRVQPSWDLTEIAWDEAYAALQALVGKLERLASGIGDLVAMGLKEAEDLLGEMVGLVRRLAETTQRLNGFVSSPDEQTIYWAEIGPGQTPLSIHAAPLHVGPLVEEHLFHKKEVVILTSATLRTDGSFDYVRQRLHAWDAEELAVDSPFDYASSTLVYIVDDIPETGQPGYQRAIEQGMAELFKATGGRALALFTSYSQLRSTARALHAPLSQCDISLLSQGQGLSRNQLLENFRNGGRAVLLGTRSFWEGIDVPGEALSCLAIAKLPFDVPSDPVFAARAETFDDPFLEYAVPEAVLRFLQGFGRLIRTRTDRGIVVVFDRRLISKAYGRVFIDSLPGPTVRRGPLTMLPRAAREWLERT